MTKENDFDALIPLFKDLARLKDTAYAQYSDLTDQIISKPAGDIVRICVVLDGLCDFCDEERFLILYKRICKHIFPSYPALVKEYVDLYHSVWGADNEEMEGFQC